MEFSDAWKPATDRPGYMVKLVKGDGWTGEIYRPILDDAERKKREAQVKAVAERTLYNYYARKEREKYEQQNNN